MHCTVNKKETVTKATVTIALDSEEEVLAFKNIVKFAEIETYRNSHNYDLKVEKQIIRELQKSIS